MQVVDNKRETRFSCASFGATRRGQKKAPHMCTVFAGGTAFCRALQAVQASVAAFGALESCAIETFSAAPSP
jgi:hypothetical protein